MPKPHTHTHVHSNACLKHDSSKLGSDNVVAHTHYYRNTNVEYVGEHLDERST